MQAADRSLRSVFVGNIPYDATEEKLVKIFSAVGPVVSFRIVFDKESGKPRGYGFCEYKDQETATSAIRNLHGHDLNGRQLRVDSASNERARDDPEPAPGNNDAQAQPTHPIQHQPNVPEPLIDAQSLINNTLCGLQPEQLFDICKQIKTSLMINPNESRHLLVQNPQLCYALLQSLVMVKAIDAQTAMNTLHKQLMQPAQLQPTMPMLPMGPPMANAGIPTSLMMQPQVFNQGMSPFAFNPQPSNLPPVNMQPVPQSLPQSVPQSVPQVQSVPNAAPADPRLYVRLKNAAGQQG